MKAARDASLVMDTLMMAVWRRGNVWDNSAKVSIFSSLETERTARKVYRTRNDAAADILNCNEPFYNPRRRHSKLGYLSPVEFEARAMLACPAVHETGSSSPSRGAGSSIARVMTFAAPPAGSWPVHGRGRRGVRGNCAVFGSLEPERHPQHIRSVQPEPPARSGRGAAPWPRRSGSPDQKESPKYHLK